LSCGPGLQGKRNAEKLRQKREAELTTGTYEDRSRTLWSDFVKEYRERILPSLDTRTRDEINAVLAHFERLVKPGRVFTLVTADVDRFIALRRKEQGKKVDSLVSPATVNNELRHLRAALGVAKQ